MKKLGAGAITMALCLGMFAMMTGAASAHHGTVTAKITCADDGGFDVAWSVANWTSGDRQLTAQVVRSSQDVVPVGTSFADGQSKTFTDRVDSPRDLTLSIGLRWSNGSTADASRTLSAAQFPDCDTPVTPAAPTVAPATCDTDGALRVPADTAQVRYVTDPAGSGPGTFTITAVPQDGFTITGTRTWTLTVEPRLTGRVCETPVVPVEPQVTPVSTCDTEGRVDFADQAGVVYTLVEGDGRFGPYTVTATAAPGFFIAEGAPTTFTGDLGQRTACVTPPAPELTPPTCEDPGTVTLPDDHPGVTYEILRDGPVVQVVARAAAGLGFAPGTVSSWTLTELPAVTGPACATATPPSEPRPPLKPAAAATLLPATGIDWQLHHLALGALAAVAGLGVLRIGRREGALR